MEFFQHKGNVVDFHENFSINLLPFIVYINSF